MKTKKVIGIILGVLLSFTAIFAIIHLVTREKVPEGALLVIQGEEKAYVLLEKLPMTKVEGTIRNGKGEEIQVEMEGVLALEALKATKIDISSIQFVKVVAEDEFSAEVSMEELSEPDKVYLAKEDGQMRLVVFGDDNAKRNVRDVVRLEAW